MKKKIAILLIIIVTIICIYLGFQTRKNNAIKLTQIKTNSKESLSYLIETKNNSIIMIDGGNSDDADHLENILNKKGGIVDSWFITIAHMQNFGALKKILENGNIQINHIYISFNNSEWYQNYEPDRYNEIESFLNLIYSEEVIGKVQDVENRFQVLIDNMHVTILNIKNPILNNSYAGFNQSMVIKITNTYKSVIFMGNISNEAAENFKNNSLDEINCDAVQVSNNSQQFVDDEIYQKMTPEYIFISSQEAKEGEKNSINDYIKRLKEKLKTKEEYLSYNGDVTLNIW